MRVSLGVSAGGASDRLVARTLKVAFDPSSSLTTYEPEKLRPVGSTAARSEIIAAFSARSRADEIVPLTPGASVSPANCSTPETDPEVSLRPRVMLGTTVPAGTPTRVRSQVPVRFALTGIVVVVTLTADGAAPPPPQATANVAARVAASLRILGTPCPHHTSDLCAGVRPDDGYYRTQSLLVSKDQRTYGGESTSLRTVGQEPSRATRPLASPRSPSAPRRDRPRGCRSSARPCSCLRLERVAATCLGRRSP